MFVPKHARANAIAAAAASALLLAGCTAGAEESGASDPVVTELATLSPDDPGGSADAAVQAMLDEMAADVADEHTLGSVLAEIRIDGEVQAQLALGEAMSGVPISIDGRFRNGAVAITYVSTVLLKVAEEGLIDLDEPIEEWLPDFPEADRVTPRMLVNMTSGYGDHVGNQAFVETITADPFQNFTTEQLLEYSLAVPRTFEPGENWDYSHSGYVVLGEVLEEATGRSLDELIAEYVIDPLELDATVPDQGPAIPEPVVHAFTLERGIWEDSTYWNPSWTLPAGAVQTSSIGDVASSFDAIVGRGEVLDEESWQAMIDPVLVGFGEPVDGCRTCRTLEEDWSYGLGVMLTGDWVKQTPLFGGYASSVVTLPETSADDGRSVTVAVAVTYTADSYDDWSVALRNYADDLALALAGELVPDNPPPTRPPAG